MVEILFHQPLSRLAVVAVGVQVCHHGPAQSRAGAKEPLPAAAWIQPLGSCALLSGLAVPDAPEEGYSPARSHT